MKFETDKAQIFKAIQSITKISNYEIYRTFNMGIAFCIVTDESNISEIEKVCHKYKTKTYRVGKIVAEKGVFVTDTTGLKVKL